MSKMSNLATGNLGEDIAVNSLKKKGYQIIERNYRTDLGEIDIICKKAGLIIFVEVKTIQKGGQYGEPFEKINYFKARKLMQNAMLYLIQKDYPEDRPWQIDVIALELNLQTKKANLKHFKNAVWQ